MENKQVQKAGDNSQQIQISNATINTGISEKRAREIFDEMITNTCQNYTQDAYEVAIKRINMFEKLLMVKVEEVEGMLEAFRDPSFQLLLAEAQKRAAAAERDKDFELLTELLVHRVENKGNRKIKASISKAVEIVNQIDDDALCALTIVYVINRWIPTNGNISEGLKFMNNLFASLCYTDLPTDFEWAYHLDILNAVRTSSIATFKTFRERYTDALDGYACIGIEKNSDKYYKAQEILEKENLPQYLLVTHELNQNFVRLNVRNKEFIKDIELPTNNMENIKRKLNIKEINALKQIWDLYSDDIELIGKFKDAFMEKWDSYKKLNLIRVWFEELPNSFIITPIGRVLAHANAQKYNDSIPNMDT